jgi:transcriptional regulator with XRE-family HTH domain
MSKLPGPDLGAFLREQRQSARLSLRQLSDLAGISNPYLSQIERGLKRPSAEILQGLARGLQVSAETLYVHAGILDEAPPPSSDATGVLDAICADPQLTDRQRAVLADVYASFVGTDEGAAARTARKTVPNVAPRQRTTKQPRQQPQK